MTPKMRRVVVATGVAMGVAAAVLISARGTLQLGHVALVLAALMTSFAVYLLWGILSPILGIEGSAALPLTEAQRARLELLRAKDTAMETLRELEFDRGTGKVGAQDYEAMRRDLEAQAIGAMKALDAEAAHYERTIESEVRKRLAARGLKLPLSADAAPHSARPSASSTLPLASAPTTPPASTQAAAPAAASPVPPAAPPSDSAAAAAPAVSADDVFAKIERLAELVKKGAITPEDFERKKQELLARI
jgi:hypothetical protein